MSLPLPQDQYIAFGSSTTAHYKTVGQSQPLVTISGILSDHRVIFSWLDLELFPRATLAVLDRA